MKPSNWQFLPEQELCFSILDLATAVPLVPPGQPGDRNSPERELPHELGSAARRERVFVGVEE